jgi:hypothetical protein
MTSQAIRITPGKILALILAFFSLLMRLHPNSGQVGLAAGRRSLKIANDCFLHLNSSLSGTTK